MAIKEYIGKIRNAGKKDLAKVVIGGTLALAGARLVSYPYFHSRVEPSETIQRVYDLKDVINESLDGRGRYDFNDQVETGEAFDSSRLSLLEQQTSEYVSLMSSPEVISELKDYRAKVRSKGFKGVSLMLLGYALGFYGGFSGLNSWYRITKDSKEETQE